MQADMLRSCIHTHVAVPLLSWDMTKCSRSRRAKRSQGALVLQAKLTQASLSRELKEGAGMVRCTEDHAMGRNHGEVATAFHLQSGREPSQHVRAISFAGARKRALT